MTVTVNKANQIKEEVYIDLSKLSERERTTIRRLLYEKREYVPYFTNLFEIDRYYKLHFDNGDWLCGEVMFNSKTELTYPDFIKLFEGGEGENGGWIKIENEADLPKENGYYFTICRHDDNIRVEILAPNNQDVIGREWYLNYYTHYQPIQKPEPPKF